MPTDYLGKALQRAALPAIDGAGNRAWVDFGLAKTESIVHQGHGRTGRVTRRDGKHLSGVDFTGPTLGGKDDGAPCPYRIKEPGPGWDGPFASSFQRSRITDTHSRMCGAEKAERDFRLAKFAGGGDAAWDESKHPRGQHGWFSGGGGTAAAGIAGAAALGAAGYAAHRFGLGGVVSRYAGRAAGAVGEAANQGRMYGGLAAGAARPRLAEAGGAVAGAARSGFQATRNAAASAAGSVGGTASRVAGAAGDAANQGRMYGGLAAGAARNRIGEAAGAVAGAGRSSVQAARTAAGSVGDTAGRAAGFAQRSASRAAGAVGDAANQGRMYGGLAAGAARNRVGEAAGAVAGAGRSAGSAVRDAASGGYQAARNAAGSAGATARRAAGAAGDAINQGRMTAGLAAGVARNRIAGAAQHGWAGIKSAGQQVANAIASAYRTVRSTTFRGARAAGDAINQGRMYGGLAAGVARNRLSGVARSTRLPGAEHLRNASARLRRQRGGGFAAATA